MSGFGNLYGSNPTRDEKVHRDLPRRKQAEVAKWCNDFSQRLKDFSAGQQTYQTRVDYDVFHSLKTTAHSYGVYVQQDYNQLELIIDTGEKFRNFIHNSLGRARFHPSRGGGIHISATNPMRITYDENTKVATISYTTT